MSATEPLFPPRVYSTHFPLDIAALCCDCSAIYPLSANACPGCASSAALPLAKVLDSDANRELVEALRALSHLLVFAKRPRRRKEVPA